MVSSMFAPYHSRENRLSTRLRATLRLFCRVGVWLGMLFLVPPSFANDNPAASRFTEDIQPILMDHCLRLSCRRDQKRWGRL